MATFLDLPAELRNAIYEWTSLSQPPTGLKRREDITGTFKCHIIGTPSGLIAMNRQINAELYSVIWSKAVKKATERRKEHVQEAKKRREKELQGAKE
ncbi:hypothetical protein LTR37_013119 [Vermiconidia calcicola]|uniref:Uncharacterized protein n=1 Tax=Vermiconidia calcicola TaxID=1690605 RepID=A0ACC3MXP1_9PEZI|nr:hypothetical protein LTR37_013119 [Vermiconidia calcicola]